MENKIRQSRKEKKRTGGYYNSAKMADLQTIRKNRRDQPKTTTGRLFDNLRRGGEGGNSAERDIKKIAVTLPSGGKNKTFGMGGGIQ